MPTFVHGWQTKLLLDAYDVSPFFSSGGFAGAVDAPDASTFGSQDKAYIAGLVDATQSLEGFWSGGTADADAIMQGLFGGTAKSILSMFNYGTGAGQQGWSMRGDQTRYEVQTSNSDAVKVTAEVQSSTAIDRVTSLRDGSIIAAGTAPAVDFGAAMPAGGVAYLHALTGTVVGGTITIESATTQGGAYTSHGTIVIQGTVPGTVPGGLGSGFLDLSGVALNRWVRANATAWSGTAAAVVVAFSKK
jgi:hypothetical protein